MTRKTPWNQRSVNARSRIYGKTALVFLATLIWQWPIFDRWLALLDEGYVLGIADQINQGQILYRDLTIDAPLPGSFHLLAWWFQWAGTSVLSSRVLTMVGFATFVTALFRIALPLTSNRWAFALVGVLWSYRIWAFPHWQFYGYAMMAAVLATVSLALVIGSRGTRPASLLLAGIAAGAAILCKQDYGGATSLTTGLALMLLPWLQPKSPSGVIARLRPAATFSIGAFSLILPTLGWYGMHGALDELYQQTVVFPFQVLGDIPHTTLPSPWPLLGQDATIRAGIGNYFPSVLATLWWNDCADCLVSGLGTGALYQDTYFWDLLLKVLFWLPILLPLCLLVAWAPSLLADRRRQDFRETTIPRVLTVAFAFGFLLAFNPPRDWVHLMMVYPATVLLPGAALSWGFTRRLSPSGRSISEGVLWFAIVGLLLFSGALMIDLRRTMDHYLPSERAGDLCRPTKWARFGGSPRVGGEQRPSGCGSAGLPPPNPRSDFSPGGHRLVAISLFGPVRPPTATNECSPISAQHDISFSVFPNGGISHLLSKTHRCSSRTSSPTGKSIRYFHPTPKGLSSWP